MPSCIVFKASLHLAAAPGKRSRAIATTYFLKPKGLELQQPLSLPKSLSSERLEEGVCSSGSLAGHVGPVGVPKRQRRGYCKAQPEVSPRTRGLGRNEKRPSPVRAQKRSTNLALRLSALTGLRFSFAFTQPSLARTRAPGWALP